MGSQKVRHGWGTNTFNLFFFFLIIWLHRVLVAAHGTFLSNAQTLVVAHRFSCSTTRGILVPRTRASPGLQGRFVTTGPQGKSLTSWSWIGNCSSGSQFPDLWTGGCELEVPDLLRSWSLTENVEEAANLWRVGTQSAFLPFPRPWCLDLHSPAGTIGMICIGALLIL